MFLVAFQKRFFAFGEDFLPFGKSRRMLDGSLALVSPDARWGSRERPVRFQPEVRMFPV
jgi:hypothetical protein